MADFEITAPMIPSAVPERFELSSVTAAMSTAGLRISIDYTSEDGFIQILLGLMQPLLAPQKF